MDLIVVEQLVERKRSLGTLLLQIVIMVAFIGLLFLNFLILAPLMGALRPFALLVVALLGYAVYRMYTRFQIEYEYTYVTGTLEVDRIMGRRKRKTLHSAKLKDLVAHGVYRPEEHPRKAYYQRILSANLKDGEPVYYFIEQDKDGFQTLILLDKNDIFLRPLLAHWDQIHGTI